MPIYDFKCDKCGFVKEELKPCHVKTIECPDCGGTMQQQICAAAGHVSRTPEETTQMLKKRSDEHSKKHIDRVAVERKIFGIE